MTRFTIFSAWLVGGWCIGCSGANETPSGATKAEPTPPPPVSYGPGTLTTAEYGAFPTTVTEADAHSAYEAFRAQYIADCGVDHGLRVTTDSDETLSEGIGHGALLAVGWDDRATFDGFLTYHRSAVSHTDLKKGATHGLMGWRIWGDACNFQEVEPGAASGAELNMAMALLQAECQWGGSDYYYSALELMDSIRNHMTAEVPEGTVLLPTDEGDDPGCMNASYMAPAYYRVFAQAQPEHAAFWNKMADDAYVFLGLAADGSTGLVPDWAPIGGSACAEATTFVGFDAIRTHWRAATDYAWFGTAAAQSWLEKVTGWFNAEFGADNLLDLEEGFFSDGSAILGDPDQGKSAFVGAFAVGAMPVNQETSDNFHAEFLAVPPANDDGYYSLTARALYLMLSVNKFSPGCYEQ